MRRVSAGDSKISDVEQAFKQIYAQEIGYVWNCLKRLGVEDRDLEDKVHDVFVIFFRRFKDFDASRPVRPWLGGISHRVASDHRRQAYKKREVLKDAVELPESGPSPEASLEQTDAQHMVMTALNTLDFNHRAVFVLHDIEGHSMPEISQMIESPLNTLYSRLRLAREKFTASVRRLGLKGESL